MQVHVIDVLPAQRAVLEAAPGERRPFRERVVEPLRPFWEGMAGRMPGFDPDDPRFLGIYGPDDDPATGLAGLEMLERARCTTGAHGRSAAIHPDARLLAEPRARQRAADGRAALRERVAVEHSRAHPGRWQGRRARYRGERKNSPDPRRAAVGHDLHVLARLATATHAA